MLDENNKRISEAQGELDSVKLEAVKLSAQLKDQTRIYQTQNAALATGAEQQQAAANLLGQTLKTLEDVRSKLADRGIETVPAQMVEDLNQKLSKLKSQMDFSRFRIFLHVSPGAVEDATRLKIESAIREAGFVLVSTERDTDFGGTRVDYFNSTDCAAARAIATLIDSNLPVGSSKVLLKPHEALNPPGWLGVWLSSRSSRQSPAGATVCP
jgi:hypothetical protein